MLWLQLWYCGTCCCFCSNCWNQLLWFLWPRYLGYGSRGFRGSNSWAVTPVFPMAPACHYGLCASHGPSCGIVTPVVSVASDAGLWLLWFPCLYLWGLGHLWFPCRQLRSCGFLGTCCSNYRAVITVVTVLPVVRLWLIHFWLLQLWDCGSCGPCGSSCLGYGFSFFMWLQL